MATDAACVWRHRLVSDTRRVHKNGSDETLTSYDKPNMKAMLNAYLPSRSRTRRNRISVGRPILVISGQSKSLSTSPVMMIDSLYRGYR